MIGVRARSRRVTASLAGRLLLATVLAVAVTALAPFADAAPRKPAKRAAVRAPKPAPPAPAPAAATEAVDSSHEAWTEARRLADQERYDDALATVRQALRRDPQNVELRWLEAGIHGWMGRHAESVAHYERLIADHPEVARDVRGDLAAARLAAGDAPGALRDLELRLTDNPGDRDARERRARALARVDRLRESLAAYDALLNETPDDVDLLMDRARVLAWMGRNRDAAAVYAQVLARDPGNRSARLGMAMNENWQGRHRVAAARLESLAAGPDADPEAMKALAHARYWNAEPERARAALDRYREREPSDREGLELLKHLEDDRSRAITGGYARSSDSDQLKVETRSLEFRHPLPLRSMLELMWREDIVRDPGGRRVPSQVGGNLETLWSPLVTTRVDVRHVRLGADFGDETVGGLSVTWRPEDRLRIDLGAARGVVMTRVALDNRIAVRSWSAGADWKLTERLRLRGSGSRRAYSDGNNAHTLAASLAWKAYSRRDLTLTPRIGVERLAARDNPGNGYYAPEQYTEWGPGLAAEWSPGKEVTLGADATVGWQRELGSESQAYGNVSGRIEWIPRELFMLRFDAGRSNSNLSTESGYERRFWGISLTRGF